MNFMRALAMVAAGLVALLCSAGSSWADAVAAMSGPVSAPPCAPATRSATKPDEARGRDLLASGALAAGPSGAAMGPVQNNARGKNAPLAMKQGIGNGNGGAVREQQRRSIQAQETQMRAMPLFNDKQYKQSELTHLKLVNGQLHAELLPGMPNSQVRIGVIGSKSLWVGNMQPNLQSFTGSIQRFDFDQLDDNQYYLTSLSIYPGGMNLQVNGIGRYASLQAAPGRVLLYVMETDKETGQTKQTVMLNEQSLQELRSKHPQEVRRILVPILVRLCGENPLSPGAGDIYGALTELQPDAAATQAIRGLLPRLDADAISERDAATAELQKLGRAGVLAAMRMDQSNLSEEQKARLQAFISSQRTNAEIDDATAANDPDFLIDCLDDADAAIQQAARQRLQKLIGHDVKLDEHLTGEARQAALDQLRDAIRKQFPTKLTPPAPNAPAPAENSRDHGKVWTH